MQTHGRGVIEEKKTHFLRRIQDMSYSMKLFKSNSISTFRQQQNQREKWLTIQSDNGSICAQVTRAKVGRLECHENNVAKEVTGRLSHCVARRRPAHISSKNEFIQESVDNIKFNIITIIS